MTGRSEKGAAETSFSASGTIWDQAAAFLPLSELEIENKAWSQKSLSNPRLLYVGTRVFWNGSVASIYQGLNRYSTAG